LATQSNFGFELLIDDERSWVVERWWGMWEVQTPEDYAAAMRKAEQHFILRNIEFRTLCDLREFPVQQQVVADVMQAYFLSGYAPASRRTAVVANSALLKMQAMRVVELHHRKFFTSMDDACAWLAS
jgi:hypothetical protein